MVKNKKKCNICELKKPLTDFYRKRRNLDGLFSYCIPCAKIKAKKHYRNRPEYRKRLYKKNAVRREGLRQFILDYLEGHPCVDCDEDRPVCLEFDHQGNKVYDISYMIHARTSIDTLKKEIAKCEVVCANCHKIRTARDQDWYKSL